MTSKRNQNKHRSARSKPKGEPPKALQLRSHHGARRTDTPGYFFGAMKAADAMQDRRGTKRTPSMPVTSSCGCIFCDLRLAPVDGMHATEEGPVKCTVRR